MSISIADSTISAIYAGSQPIREVYHGADLVWSGLPTVKQDLGWQRAHTQPLRIMFVGSSTVEGYGTTVQEGFVSQLVAAICKQALGAPATVPVRQNTGTVTTRTTPGFHFLNAGVGGTNATTYISDARLTMAQDYSPHIVIHMIGSNDYAQQRKSNAYRSDVEMYAERITTRVPGVQHIFIHSYRREDREDTGTTWDDYGAALKEAADRLPNAAFVDAHAWFEHLRVPGRNYLQDDRIHALWTGNALLVDAVAAALRFDNHEGAMIYGVDAAAWPHLADGTAMSSWSPVDRSLAAVQMKSSGTLRPILRDRAGVRSLDFTNGNKSAETVGWPGVHSLPITVYMVTSSLGASGTNLQPFFTRSVAADDGYIWGWRERDANLLKAASNSAANAGVSLPRATAEKPAVLAMSFLPSGHIRLYANSTNSISTALLSPDQALAPWMRSLKLGTNTANTAWTEMDVREMYWHHGMDVDRVQTRIQELADKHGIALLTRVGDWVEVANSGTVTVPGWADTVELVAIGGGGGGGAGNVGAGTTATGGAAGTWVSGTYPCPPGTPLVLTVGSGGSGAAKGAQTSGLAGQFTVATSTAGGWRAEAPSGAGGVSATGDTVGAAAGDFSAFGRAFTGGTFASANEDGKAPGGGGGPGTGGIFGNGNPGRRGGAGRIWYRFSGH